MKVYLDDVRTCPIGWVLAQTSDEAIDLLATGEVTHLSLDYDLGPPEAGCGYDVVKWMEEQIMEKTGFELPIIYIHSANPVGRIRMAAGIKKIQSML